VRTRASVGKAMNSERGGKKGKILKSKIDGQFINKFWIV